VSLISCIVLQNIQARQVFQIINGIDYYIILWELAAYKFVYFFVFQAFFVAYNYFFIVDV